MERPQLAQLAGEYIERTEDASSPGRSAPATGRTSRSRSCVEAARSRHRPAGYPRIRGRVASRARRRPRARTVEAKRRAHALAVAQALPAGRAAGRRRARLRARASAQAASCSSDLLRPTARDERRSTIVRPPTSRSASGCEVFGDEKLTTALLDRLGHHSHSPHHPRQLPTARSSGTETERRRQEHDQGDPEAGQWIRFQAMTRITIERC